MRRPGGSIGPRQQLQATQPVLLPEVEPLVLRQGQSKDKRSGSASTPNKLVH